MISTYLPLITLIIGTFLGLFSTFIISSLKQRQDVTLRLLDQFFAVRQEVVDTISELTNLRNQDLTDAKKLLEYRNAVTKLFYKSYDFLPKTVLDGLILLEACLKYPKRGPYRLKNDVVIPMKKPEIVKFLSENTLIKNPIIFLPLVFQCGDSNSKAREAIKLHARYVLYCLNSFASTADLLLMTKKLKKKGR